VAPVTDNNMVNNTGSLIHGQLDVSPSGAG